MTATDEADCLAIRARDVVSFGPTLQAEAATLTDDLNEAYLLVHRTVAQALAEPICGTVSVDDLTRDLTDRYAGPAAVHAPGSA